MPNATILGFDLGGTKSAIARYDATAWTEEAQEKIPTNAGRGFAAVVDHVVELASTLRTPQTRAMGIGVPGLVTQPEGTVLSTPNIAGAEGFRLKEILEEKLRLPVFVDNDARCFTLAEAIMGAGKSLPVVLGITMGTGVGGGLVINGEIFHGAHGYAGEVGHMLLMPGQPPYPTDNKRGEAEQFFSGTAMGKRCEAAKRPEDYLEGEACAFLQPSLFREIAWLVTSLTHLADPSIVIFGGSAGRALKPHLREIEAELLQWMLPGTPPPRLAVSAMANTGCLGAALLAKD